jgi:predicted enzyme related to lactoylglutathione lyase
MRKPGDFCWINMLTPNPKESLDFYGKLLGWTFGEIPGMGYNIKVAGKDVGGLFDTVSPRTPEGTAPMIGVMVKVKSADETAAKVKALGGKADQPFDIMDAGRMAVCHDPNGAQLDIWEPKKMTGTEVDTRVHGAPTWFETITGDTAKAGKFYSGLFGWTTQVQRMMDFEYTSFVHQGDPIAGMMPILPRMGDMRPAWWVYFAVKDAARAEQQAVELGGKITLPMMEIPGIGRCCGITSPQGVWFYVIQYND